MDTVIKIKQKIINTIYPKFIESFPKVVNTQESKDSTIKFLFEYSDGLRAESVIMPFYKRYTVCLSSQIGCAMGCSFCNTGSQGLFRNLSAEEIISQYLSCYQWILEKERDKHVPKPNIVFMGEGEPLHNFQNLKEACEIILSKKGIYLGPRQITISTAGYLPGLVRFNELPSVNFALSLHSAIPHKREKLIPLEKKYSLQDLLPIIKDFNLKNNQYINFEYLLIAGFNNSLKDAEALSSLIGKFKSIVNIIPYNEIEGISWKSPNDVEIKNFKDMLVKKNIRTMVRISRGSDINAACGQLKGSQNVKLKEDY